MINYPDTLPQFRISKSRQEQQKFRTSQPFAGSLYIEKVTDDTPVLWSVTILCKSQVQSRQFKAFLRSVENGETFIIPILTEEGFIDHEVRFIEMPLSPTQINSSMFEYSGVIYATKLNSVDENVDDDLIYEWLQDANIIDVAMNQIWPVVDNGPIPVLELFSNEQLGVIDRATIATYTQRFSKRVVTAALNTLRENKFGWMFESDSTNLMLRSEELTTTWQQNDISFTQDGTIVPEIGEMWLGENTTGLASYIRQAETINDTDNITMSMYAKRGNQPLVSMRIAITGGTADFSVIVYNFDTDIITGETPEITAQVEKLCNGIVRLEATVLNVGLNTTVDARYAVGDYQNPSIGDTCYITGLMAESKIKATSYIKSTDSITTRVQDSSLTPAVQVPDLFSDWSFRAVGHINSISRFTGFFPFISIPTDVSSGRSGWTLYYDAPGERIRMRIGNVTFNDIGSASSGIIPIGARFDVIVTKNNSKLKFYLNGTELQEVDFTLTESDVQVITSNDVEIGNEDMSSSLITYQMWDQELSQSEIDKVRSCQ